MACISFRRVAGFFLIASLCACGGSDDPVVVDSDGGVCQAGFATSVVSVKYGEEAGFGQADMPTVVLGPPRGDLDDSKGSLDVVSLGLGGEIVLSFGFFGIADEPGEDFIVFENAFYRSGVEPKESYAEPAQVSVSNDGTHWIEFPCDSSAYPYVGCAGTMPVYSNPDNGISAFDPKVAGGNAFDLSKIGVASARYVRIRDLSSNPTPKTSGFDLDAISVIHPACE